MTGTTPGILLVNSAEIEVLLNLDQSIAAVEDAFRKYAEGKAMDTGMLHASAPHGDFHIKTGGVDLRKLYFGLKSNGRYPRNQERHGLPNVQGVIYLADGENGMPLALMDSALITLYRTGAATAVAAKFLAKSAAAVVTVCGCGRQGRVQLSALARVRRLEKAYVYGRNPERVHAFSEEMSHKLDIPVIPVSRLSDATRKSSIVVTCTSARAFFLRSEDIAPGTFVAAIGADSADKQELDPGLMIGNKLVVDNLEQAAHVGELHHAIDKRLLTTADVHAELGQIVAGQKEGRTTAEEIVIFDATGTALLDVSVAAAVYERAIQAGKGIRVSLRT